MDKLTFGSLFAGIGGFDLGFERAGMVCKWQVEINDYATKVLAKHWPSVDRQRDIKQCGRHNLERVDVICGGFPCQDISYAGRGAGLDGERSRLFFEALRVVCELRPRAVVLENVAGLLTRGLDRVLGSLAEIGYDAEWHCIPAAAVGAPHIRDRVFVLADAKLIKGGERHNSAMQRRRQEQTEQAWMGSWSKFPDSNVEDAQGQRQESVGIKSQQRDASHESWWAVEPAVGRVANGVPHRVDRLRGLGNAVVPQVAEYVGRRVVEVLTA